MEIRQAYGIPSREQGERKRERGRDDSPVKGVVRGGDLR